jgi:hypothetical protein
MATLAVGITVALRAAKKMLDMLPSLPWINVKVAPNTILWNVNLTLMQLNDKEGRQETQKVLA